MTPAAGLARSPAFLARWTLTCGLAELLGIAVGAFWWVAWDRVEPSPDTLGARLSMLAAKGTSGVLEGLVLGLLQAWLLRRLYPSLPMGRWAVATCLLAVVGWTVGSSFSIFAASPAAGGGFDPGPAATGLFAALFGVVVGAVFGAAQAVVLRRVAWRAWIWVLANAAGWAMALPSIYIAASVGGAVLPLAAASGVAAGLLLGLATGVSLRWMPARGELP